MSISSIRILQQLQGRSLRTKLMSGVAFIVVSLLLVDVFVIGSQIQLRNDIDQVMKLGAGISKFAVESGIALNEAFRMEKDFFLQIQKIGFEESKAQHIPRAQARINDVRENMKIIRNLDDNPEVIRWTNEIDQALDRYEAGLLQVVELVGRLGYGDTGIEGQTREIAHALETVIMGNPINSLVGDLLALRGYEEDAVLSGRTVSLSAFKKKLSTLRANVAEAKLPSDMAERLIILTDRYEKAFEEYVSMRIEIRSAMETYRHAVHSVEPLQRRLMEWTERSLFSAHKSAKQLASNTIWIGIIGVCFAVLVSVLAAFLVLRGIQQGVHAITAFADRLTEGDLSFRVPVRGEGEFSDLGAAMNKMADALQQAQSKMEAQQVELTSLNKALRQEVENSNLAERVASYNVKRLSAVLETASDAIITIDHNGLVILWNPSAARIFGYSSEEIMNQPVTRLMPERYVDDHLAGLKRAGSPKVYSGHYEVEALRADGTEFPVELTLSNWVAEDKVYFTAIVRDVTDRKNTEQRQADLTNRLFRAQKAEALATLVGAVAHDFNNLLTIILGYAELLMEDKNENALEYQDLERIRDTARKGADLVYSLLALSRQAGLSPSPMDLNFQIEQIHKLLLRTLPKMISTELRLAGDLAKIYADPSRIDQVIMNLAINAKEAMPDGGKLLIETKNLLLDEDYCQSHIGTKPGKHVMLTIADTGLGMDKATLERIFDPFFTTKQRDARKGTGLGLSVAQGIVEQHGGHIISESRPGEGTTFKVYFPAFAEVEENVDSTSAKEASSVQTPAKTILLVDDEELIRGLAQRILTKEGYRVLTAGNGKEALAVYAEHGRDISLVVLDLIMPEMSGYQCLAELLKINPNLSIVVSSGFSDEGGTKDILDKGAKAFIKKPYRLDELIKVIQECDAANT